MVNTSIGDIDVRTDAGLGQVYLDAYARYNDATVAMWPDEARAVAKALLSAADIAEWVD